MSAPEVNIPLLRKAVEWAEAEAAKPLVDRQWIQDSWISGPRSVAWLAVEDTPYETLPHLGAVEVVDALEPHCGTAYCIAGWVSQSLDARYANDSWGDGLVHVAQFAGDALGLGEEQRDRLFNANNTIADVRRIAEDLAGERL